MLTFFKKPLGGLSNLAAARVNLFIATVFFSAMQVCVKFLGNLPSVELAFFRALVALVICYFMIKIKKIDIMGSRSPLLWVRGILGTFGLVCFFYSLQNLELAHAVTIQYVAPLLTVLFAGLFWKESASLLQWVFFIFAFTGVIISQGFGQDGHWLAFAAGLLGSVFSAFAYNVIRLLAGKDDPNVIVFYFPLVTVPVLALPAWWSWVSPVGVDWLFLLGLGVTTQGAQVYMTKAYQMAPASKVAYVSYLGVPIATATGLFFFNEWPNAWEWFGMSLVVGSVGLANFVRANSTEQI